MMMITMMMMMMVMLLKDLAKDLGIDGGDDETRDDDDVKDEKEKSKIEKDRLGLIKSRIRKPKRKLMKLLRDLEKDDDDEVDITNLKDLVKAFLDSEEKEIDQQLQDALNGLTTSSKSIEIGMLLREIEKINGELAYILYRLADAFT